MKTLAAHYSPEQMQVFLRYYSLETVQQNLHTQKLFCAEHDGQIIGTVGLDGDLVVGFYTRIDCLGRGIGKALMHFLHGHARASQLKKLRLLASPVAVEFYLRLGYRVLSVERPLYLGVSFEETLMEIKLC